MISIITPFFQSEKYIEASIYSVLKQSFDDWELLLINDGSYDQSKDIALSFKDPRIRYFEQNNKGVSAARNFGLSKMKGQFFCFLDSDDILTPNSLKSRITIFNNNPKVHFVDGKVIKMNESLNTINQEWLPKFNGNPMRDLVSLSGNSFLGLTWMVKRITGKNYQFETQLTHSEDLYFYLQLAREGGKYAYTKDPVLYYRDTPNSAMSKLKELENSYQFIEKRIKNWDEIDIELINTYQYRYKRAMFLAYLRNIQPINAIKSIF